MLTFETFIKRLLAYAFLCIVLYVGGFHRTIVNIGSFYSTLVKMFSVFFEIVFEMRQASII